MKTRLFAGGWIALGLGLGGCQTLDSEPQYWPRAKQDDQVSSILARLDDMSLTAAQRMEDYRTDAVILIPNETEIRGEAAVLEHLGEFGHGVDLAIKHEVVESTEFADLVVVQGRVTGTAKPHGQDEVFAFETKNLILMRPDISGALKIWKVIYNAAPVSGPE